MTLDATDEVFLLSADALTAVDVDAATRPLMAALPHRKVWVVGDSEKWQSEPL